MEKYIRQTHAKTHNQYHLEVLDVFEVDRQGEKEGFKDVGNRSGFDCNTVAFTISMWMRPRGVFSLFKGFLLYSVCIVMLGSK